MQRLLQSSVRIALAWLVAAGSFAGLPAQAADGDSTAWEAASGERVVFLVVRTSAKPVAEGNANIVPGSGQYMLASAGGNMTGKTPRWSGAPAAGALLQDGRRRFDAPASPLEAQLFVDAADGRLDVFSPFDAALVAGGIQDAGALQRYHEKASAMAEELRRLDAPNHSPHERIEAVFEFMHRRILRGGYDLTYTDLRRVLDEGRYNCVSATVLLNYLAGEIGLECRGLEMPGHAMSRAALPEGTFDIENTCPRWFRLDERLRQAEEARAAGVQNGPKLQADRMEYEKACRGDRSKAREVSPIQLAAMIYYNLGVDLLNAKHFAEAAGANAKAVRLDPKKRDGARQPVGHDQQLVDRAEQCQAIRRGGGSVAARAGDQREVRAVRPELRPRPPPMGRASLQRAAVQRGDRDSLPGDGRNARPRLPAQGAEGSPPALGKGDCRVAGRLSRRVATAAPSA